MAGLVFLAFFATILFWLLWAPLRIEIDSERGRFAIEWKYICAIEWLPEIALDRLQIRVFFIRRSVALSGSSKKKKPADKPEKQDQKPKRRKPVSMRTMWRLARNLLRTFEVKRLQLLWDSDDFIWNAQAYPLACMVNGWSKANIQINFTGQRELALLVENRLGRILWAVLHTFTTKR